MDPRTLGVEEEFQVVDLATGELVPRAQDLLPRTASAGLAPFTRELNLSQVETGTPVCESLDEVAATLATLRRALVERGAAVGLGIAAVGTHPTGRWQDQRVDRTTPRFRRMEHEYQVIAREQIICGCHVHVAVEDPDLRVRAMTRLRPWLPVLLALSANSPCWDGRDTGYASYRHQVWQRWPTAGFPPALDSYAAYEGVVDQLVDAGAVADASYLYWYARPSLRYPTVEVRACDTLLTAADATTLAGLVRALVWTEASRAADGAPAREWAVPVLDAAMWQAARYGIRGDLLSPRSASPAPAREVVGELLAHVGPALDVHGDRAAVTDGVARLLAEGTGADRQRRILASGLDARALVEPVAAPPVAAAG